MNEVETLPAGTAPLTEQLAHAVADALGQPLPADWQDPRAVRARQDHLSAVASFASASLIELALARGAAEDKQTEAAARFAAEMVALDDAMRGYTHGTQRDDVMELVQNALEASIGGTLAAGLIGMLERVRAMRRIVSAAGPSWMKTMGRLKVTVHGVPEI